MSGDRAQLPPTVISAGKNESDSGLSVSLFEQLIGTGLSDIQLRTQYRMAPGIANFVKEILYQISLVTDPPVVVVQTQSLWAGSSQNAGNANLATQSFFKIMESTVSR